MADEDALRCPVCRAQFRQSRTCSRCGTELTPLMLLAGRAHQLRQSAASALRAGDLPRAASLARQAQAVHATDRSRRLAAVTALLARRLGH